MLERVLQHVLYQIFQKILFDLKGYHFFYSIKKTNTHFVDNVNFSTFISGAIVKHFSQTETQ